MALEDRLRRVAGGCGLAAAAVGMLAFAGWLWNFDPFSFLRLNAAPMKPDAALCLILVGGGLFLQFSRRAAAKRAADVCLAAALLISLTVLALRWYQIDYGFHELLSRVMGYGGDISGLRMSLHSGLVLTGITVAVGALRQTANRDRWPVSAWLANLVIGLCAAGLLALEFGGLTSFTRPLRFSSHLSLALIILGLGTLLARPEDRHIRVLFSRTTAGMLARRLLLAVAILPVFLGALAAWFVRTNQLTLADAVVLFVAAVIACGFAIALFSIEAAATLYADREVSEQARQQLTTQLQAQAEQLKLTVRQQTQELRDANASLRTVADSATQLALVAQHTRHAVMITDAEGRLTWVNTAFTRLTGYTLDEIKGRKPGHFLRGPETDPATIAIIRDAERRGQPCEVEILNYTKQGTPFWQFLDIQPVREKSGRLTNFVANQTDITGQRADRHRLEQLNQRLELATRAADVGVWEWDAINQRNIWDRRTLEMYGIRPNEFRATREEWINRLHPDDRAAALKRVQEAVLAGDHYEQEFRIIRANDGAVRSIETRAIVQRDRQGRVLRIIGTERDITADREAKVRIESLNERLQLALRSSNYGVWEFDLIASRRHWDDRILEMFGMPRSEFDPARAMWLERVHPDDRATAATNMQRVLAGELPEYAITFRVIRPDGSVRHLESLGHLHRDARGNPTRLVGLSRDITEQKQMAQALELAEKRWQLAIEGSNDSVWDWDLESGRIFRDDRWPRMLGYAPGELAEESPAAWKARVHPDDLAANEGALNDHLAGHTPHYQQELRLRARDDSWRWILDRGKVVSRDPDGRPLRMAGTHTDITERKLLEQRLRKSEELASEVSRLARIGGWELDLAARRVIWTDGTRRIHEVDESFQPSTESMWQFFPPDALARVQAAFNDATPAAPSFDIEVALLTARGRRLWVRILGHGEFKAGKAVSIHGAIQDVTAQHESEEARRQLETQLFQAQKMETLGTLAGGIAHDFNNLLTGIIGYHELAADSLPEDHPSRFCLTEARNASLRARELVEQILTFGRQTGRTEHDAIDLSLVIEEARRFLRATIPANISIEVHCAPYCGTVVADATQIHQVILNLGSNGAHAMRQQGGLLRITLEPTEVSPDLALTLGASTANSYVRLSVSDNGHGMDESTRRRIFDPFFTTKNTREGTGLGLAVVHGIVRSHRGAIDVESSPGSGSTFHIYLPTVNNESETPPAELESAPRGGGEYVCVVDDEEVVGSCTKLVLENKGYRSLVFSSAETCLAEIETDPGRCTVLVTDQTMPGMQGTELAAAIRRLKPGLPVVIMSGYFSKISPQALDNLGQVELLGKPFTTDELLHAVHRALHPVAKVS